MKYRRLLSLAAAVLGSLCMIFSAVAVQDEAIVAEHNVIASFESIPASVIEQIKTGYRIFYGHTSHGSQIVTGMEMLRDINPLYDFNNGKGTLYIHEYGDDLGGQGDTTWVPPTREHLAEPGGNYNIVIWSWCGGVSDNTVEGINIYLNAINQLEQEYPNVVFVFMTGHLDGGGPAGNLYLRNNQIRDYCRSNDKILFDFADIESYDPDGTYYPDETDACNWCSAWCTGHTCPSCGGCAHSHCFNCFQKGKAFWWLMAKAAGWNQEPSTCGDINGNGFINIQDITHLINFIYRGGPAPVPPATGDVNNSGAANIQDITYLINYLYKGGPEPVCP
ncbi:MAG: dockerin type I domain-containing protein [candidate division Zixibacteria bacterium]|nr:dockerin type I domain-containing protein [candidate division Zixibacteria bacterium]